MIEWFIKHKVSTYVTSTDFAVRDALEHLNQQKINNAVSGLQHINPQYKS